MYVRTSSGNMAPVGQFVTLTKTYGPEILSRFNLFSCISVNASAAQGYSSGDAIQAVQEVAKETLPSGYGFEFGGTSREEASSGTSIMIIFIICILFVYIILCSLYESLFIPLAVMLSIPFGLAGSFLFARIFGVENNIYMQTGLIMLIGLLAKTAILLTEYASERRKHGMSIAQAALPPASDPDDCADDDYRSVPAGGSHRCRSQRKYFARRGNGGRYADRNGSLTVCRPRAVYHFPDHRGESDAETAYRRQSG